MWKNKLCLGLMETIGSERLNLEDEIHQLHETRFEGFSAVGADWTD